MPDASELSAVFAAAHPTDAARVLETLAAPDTADFIVTLEPRLAASIVRQLGPPYAARVIGRIDESHAAAVFQFMGPQAAARLVQQLPHDRQLKLLARLPVGTSIAIRLLVGYPRGTCGACMDPWPLALAPDTAAGDALEQIRKFDGDIGDCVFVSNGQRRLVGVVGLGDLLRAPSGEPLSTLMHAATHTLSALASVSVVEAHPGWEAYHVLPVVERENRLVGALHRHALSAALAAPAAPSQQNAASGVFAAYWQVVSALAEVAVSALPPVPPLADGKDPQ
ncbi:MAG TPA: CBS domain-containing protein [Burkholderiales bacterium]|nr:CBS domain-containing protein [Burkholderiales bacterium]